jgi:hypothetical protein
MLSSIVDKRIVAYLVSLLLEGGRVSTHLGCLRWCGFVTAHRESRQVLDAIANPQIRELLKLASTMMQDYAAGVASCGVIR